MNKSLQLFLNFLGSVALALAVNVIAPQALTSKEQFFLAVAVFLSLTVIETLYQLNGVDANVQHAVDVRELENRSIAVRNEVDSSISEVQRLLIQLSVSGSSHTDLFFEYFKKKLHDLQTALNDACVKQQSQIDETMFAVTDWLYGSSFLGRESDILRAVLPSGDLEFFFDVHARMYFKKMFELIQDGSAKGVRRLLVVDNAEDLRDARMQRLVAFHDCIPGYECRKIARNQFARIVADYRLQHLVVDFGIYGNSYLYKGLTNNANEIVGIYSKDPSELAVFTQCFESAWNAGVRAKSAFSCDPAKMTIDWLFDVESAMQSEVKSADSASSLDQSAALDSDGGVGS